MNTILEIKAPVKEVSPASGSSLSRGRSIVQPPIELLKMTKRCPECGREFEATFPKFLARPGTLFYETFRKGEAWCNGCIDLVSARESERARTAKLARSSTERQQKWQEIIPPIYAETSDHLLPAIARENLSRVAHWPTGSKGLLLMGPTGRGKTRLLWMLAERVFVLEGKQIEIRTAAQFSHECTRAYSYNGEGAAWSERMISADVLFIDDLGKGRMTERTQMEFFGIVDSRMVNKRPMVISMNHDGASLASSLSNDIGEALVRRLRECCEVVAFP